MQNNVSIILIKLSLNCYISSYFWTKNIQKQLRETMIFIIYLKATLSKERRDDDTF